MDLAVLTLQLDLLNFRVFSNLHDSVVLLYHVKTSNILQLTFHDPIQIEKVKSYLNLI